MPRFCSECGTPDPESYDRSSRCKPCDHRRRQLQRYGITDGDYRILLRNQGNSCAICKEPFGQPEGKSPRIDHCHDTGKVRGLLCDQCNLMLGHARDSASILMNALAYLRRNHRK